MRRWFAVLMLLVPACAVPAPVPTTPVPITEKAIAAIAEEHLGPAFAAYSTSIHTDEQPDVVGAAVHYRATADARLWSASVTYGPSVWMIAGRCEQIESEAPRPRCFWQDGVRVAWVSDSGEFFLTSERKDSFVNIVVENATRHADPRDGTGQVPLARLIALAADPRLDATTDAGLAAAAEAITGWTDDPGCERAATTGPIPLPATSGTASEPISPQAIAAVVASRVAGTCAADWNPVTPGPVGGMVYLTSGREWVAAYLSTDQQLTDCQWDECSTADGVMTAIQFAADETYQTHVRMVRRIEGGYLVVEEAALDIDDMTRAFPVPLSVLRALVLDQKLAYRADPALNAAGGKLPIGWRLLAYTGE